MKSLFFFTAANLYHVCIKNRSTTSELWFPPSEICDTINLENSTASGVLFIRTVRSFCCIKLLGYEREN